jgi:hypothetical protein
MAKLEADQAAELAKHHIKFGPPCAAPLPTAPLPFELEEWLGHVQPDRRILTGRMNGSAHSRKPPRDRRRADLRLFHHEGGSRPEWNARHATGRCLCRSHR